MAKCIQLINLEKLGFKVVNDFCNFHIPKLDNLLHLANSKESRSRYFMLISLLQYQ